MQLASFLGRLQPVELLIRQARVEHHRRSVPQVWCRSPLGIPESGCISTIREEKFIVNLRLATSSFFQLIVGFKKGLLPPAAVVVVCQSEPS